MPPKKEQKSKEQKALAAAGASKSKGRKKKWSKGKSKDRKNNAVCYDAAGFDKMLKEIPKSKVITVATMSEKLKVNGALARRSLDELEKRGLIKRVVKHHSQRIYTKLDGGKEEVAEKAPEVKGKKQAKVVAEEDD